MPFWYPVYPSEGFFPNQGRLAGLAGLRQSNQFRSYIEGLDGVADPSSRGNGSPGFPYFRSSGSYRSAHDQFYQPNAVADQDYYTKLQALNQLYYKATGEKDPRKRAQLLRDYERQRLQFSRRLGSQRRVASTARPAPAASAPSASAPAARARPRVPATRSLPLGSVVPRSSSAATRAREPILGEATSRERPPALGTVPELDSNSALSPLSPLRRTPSILDSPRRNSVLDRARRATEPIVPARPTPGEATSPAPP
jgi:hypothetical protein